MANNNNTLINFGTAVTSASERHARNYDDLISELRKSDQLVVKYLSMSQQLNALVNGLDKNDDDVVNIVSGLEHLGQLHQTFTTDIQVLQQADEQSVQQSAAVFSDIQADMKALQQHITNLNESLTHLKRAHQNEMRKLSVDGLE